MTEAVGDGWWSGGSARVLRWLSVPATIAVFALVALALSSESRDQFNDRHGGPETQASPQPARADESGGSTTPSDGPSENFNPSEEFTGWGRDGTTQSGAIEVVIADDQETYRIMVDQRGRVSAARATETGEQDRSSGNDDAYGAIRLGVTGELELVPLGDEKRLDVLVSPSADRDGLVLELIAGFNPDDNTEPVIGAKSKVLYRDGELEVAYSDGTLSSGADTSEPLVAMETRWARIPTADSGFKTFATGAGPIKLWYGQDGDLMADRVRFEASIEPGQDEAIVLNGSVPVVVAIEDLHPDDVAITPSGGGFNRIAADGITTEFWPGNGSGALTATEVDAEGARIDLRPDEDATVELSDGATASPIAPHIVIPTPRGPLPWRLIAITIATIVIASIALALSLHLRRGEGVPTLRTDATRGEHDGTVDPFERLMAELAADPDQTRAVRRAFAEAERGHGALPPRNPSETPFEWSMRVTANNAELELPVTVMCDLFAKARFAPGLSTEADRQAMLQHLRASRELASGRQTVMSGAEHSK